MSVEKERRAGGPRVPLHTLVEIGAGEGGSAAFEAEAVDVTTAGMHLKTAYLPEVGEPLVCRFEGGGTEVVVQGEVAWRTEDSYGGDFGVRFLEMDQESLDALRAIAGEEIEGEGESEGDEQAAPANPAVGRGTRVRLHIEGLGSPMKARVREGTHHEVLVGSNLEFLRVGRTLDLENVDAESNRPARIERISVEVEPTSRVPQLIVALRYLDVSEEEPAAMETQYADDEADEQDDGAYANGDGEDEVDSKPGAGAAVWSKVKKVGPKFAVLGAVAHRWGVKAKDAVGDAVVVVKKKAAQKVEERKAAATPRRTTAPPPKGGYRGAGLRKQNAEEVEEAAPVNTEASLKKHLNKRTAMIAVVALLVLIVGGGLARAAFQADPDEVAAADEASAQVEDQADAPIVPGSMGTDSGSAGLVANVPLFGPKPMSTAAPMAPMAAVPVPAVGNAALPPGDEGNAAPNEPAEENVAEAADEGAEEATDSEAASATVAVDDSEADDDESAEPDAKPAKQTAKSSKKTAKNDAPKSFGRGRLNNPVVLTLRMNRKIKDLRGVAQSDGFAIDVIGARSAEPAAGLRRQDSRIAVSKVVNRGSNSQLSIRFKGAPPAYRVQASGSTLRILIDGDKKTASTQSDRGKKRR